MSPMTVREQAAQARIAHAQEAIDKLIDLIELREINLIVSDHARHEILRMLRFYKYCVTDGCTPEASAERATAYIDSIRRDYQSGLLSTASKLQNS